MTRISLLACAVMGLSLSNPALACAVCQDPNDPRAGAYFNMTMFMSLFPLAAMAFVGWWLYRQYNAVEPGSEVHSTRA